MRNLMKSRFLAALLALVMVVSMLPVAVFAAETANHVVINQVYGGGGNKGAQYTHDFVELYNPTNADVSLEGWSVQYASKAGTFGSNTVALSGTIKAGSFYLIQLGAGAGNGVALPTPDATGSISAAAKEFKVALVNGTDAITGSDDASVVDFVGAGGATDYETAAAPAAANDKAVIRNVDGVDTDDNSADFSAAAPNPRNSATSTGGTDPDPDPDTPTVTVVPISTALAGEADAQFTVKGVVTLVDGKNVYLQDDTGAICLRLANDATDIALGDTLIGTGIRADYSGTPQLGSGTYEKSSGLVLAAEGTTIGALTTADICTYVKLTNLEVTAVSGTTITVKDEKGSTIQIYKAVSENVTVGATIDFTGAVGAYNTTLQLRNTLASEIVVTNPGTQPDTPAPTVVPISTALAGEADAEFTVKGVVTLLDGKNVFIQDTTGGICLYLSAAPTDLSLGDTVIGTGKRTDYKGLPELTGATYEKSSGLTLSAKETTIGALTTADICTYVKLTGLEVTAIDGSTITVKDEKESTIQIYKAVSENVTVGATIDFTGAVGIYNSLQLRNTLASEIVVTNSGTTPDPNPEPDDPSIVPISTALAGEANAEFTVKGVVTLLDYQNVYLQDATGGICLRLTSAPTDLALGDTVIGTGLRATYNGLPQLGSGTYEKSSGLTLSPKETTIGALTTADICTYVKLTGLEVTEVYDNNGAYSTPNITMKDSTGATIQLYKAIVDTVAVGDVVTVQAAVSAYNTTLQLRNTLATEVTVTGSGTTPDPDPTPSGKTAQLVTKASDLNVGDEIVIVSVDESVAMSTTQNGNNRGNAAVTKSGTTVTFGDDVQIITLEAGTVTNTHAFFVGEGYLFAASNSSNWLRTEAAKSGNSSWTVTINETDGVATIKANGGNGRNWLRYNNSNDIFSCYASGQKDVQIYKVVKEDANPLADGSKVVIYNPANMMALSTTYNGFYNNGTAVTMADGVLSGYTEADVWTVGVNDDGTYTFSTADGKKLSMGSSFTSTPLDDVNTAWEVSEAETEDCVYIKNAVRGNYLEWYSTKSNWSTYYKISDEALFAQTFYKVPAGGAGSNPVEGLPAEDDLVVIYNLDAEGVLALQDDNTESPSITNALATVADGKATAENGALIFKVEKNGAYYRFYNETYGYLCSNGTGNNAFYQTTASEDADWTLAPQGTGFTMESRTAKFNGTYSQYMEYYAGAYKTYSMYNVTDYDIYTFQFYPCANTDVTAGVVNAPEIVYGAMTDAYLGVEYSFGFTVSAPFGVKEVSAACGETTLEVTTTAEGYSVVVPATAVVGEELSITISGKDNKDVAFRDTVKVAVLDEPVFTEVTPEAGSQTKEEKKPVISVKVANAGEEPVISMKLDEEEVTPTYENGVISYTPAEDMEDGRVTVTVTVTREDGKTATRVWSFTVGEAQYQLYFGQLHSHTTYSDGSGTLESALEYVGNLPESANVDFVAFTDHSNYFDKSGEANPESALYDMAQATAYSQATWAAYNESINRFNESQVDVVALAGFEMTWSGGPGHINTFNTPGIVSRNNTTLNNKTADAGMKAYYALLSRAEGADSISQFNHPGTTFGTFTDFAYWDAVLDTRMFLVEVGNGEGQIGGGGYFPSYEYYTMALDKGWHVAPTNNQDNHKGKWGNGNDARDVVITDNFTTEGIYEAIRNYRIYATEDKNLEIYYTVNDMMMGYMFSETPEKLNIAVNVADPDASDSISKVEVIVNSGKTAYTWSDPAVLATGNLTCELDPNYSYYYIRVTQGDGDLAVTAPVWVGEVLKLGISSVECATSTPVTGEELTINTTLFNSESAGATVKALTYAIKGGEVIGTDTTGYTIPASGTVVVPFKYTPTDPRLTTVTVTAVVEAGGQEYTFTMDVTLDVQNADNLVYIGIDASHYNEYVAGNYKDSMGNFSQLAAEYSVRTVDLTTSEALIAACSNPKYKALILTAPSRRLPAAQEALLGYTAEELAAIKAFNDNGGMVILAGWSDNYEKFPNVPSIANMAASQHMAATQNAILETLGSCLRIGDDATYDDSFNGGQAYRLYFNTYNYDSFLVEGVEVDEENPHDRLYTEVFSYYGGATVYTADGTLPATVTPVVYGHSSTYSVDVDGDGLGGDDIPKYAYAEGDNRLMVVATEQLSGKGLIVVSGAAFMSNFEVQATIEDSASEKNYANYKVCENLLKEINPVTITPIADVQAQEGEGYKFTIEGVVTSNASGYDKDTAFFDCIYLQDETAGINAFPVAGNFKIGDLVRITGTTSSYNGERQIAVTEIELIGDGTPVEPTEITAEELNDGSVLGSLITLKGTVESFELANGLVQTIMVKDADGNVGRVFIDGYITTAEDVKDLEVGCEITVTGLASYDNSFDGVAPRIRIRNRADVVCTPIPTYSVTVSDTDDGTVTADKETAAAGEEVTLTVVPGEGKVVDTVTIVDANNGAVQFSDNNDGTYTFSQPAGDVTVTVTFKDAPVEPEEEYEVTVETPENGTVTVSDESPKAGETVVITVAADEGSVVDTVTVTDDSGAEVTVTKNADGTYSFVQPASDVTVTVTFKAAPAEPEEEYEVTVESSASGTTTVSNEDPVAGETVIITATADEGCVVDKVTVTDASGKAITVTKNADGTYSFVQPENDVVIEVTFKTDYKIVEGDGSSAENTGDKDLTFKANGAFGKFVGIEVDGKAVDAANYTAKAGSTIVTLKGSFLKTLTVGQHTITVKFSDGQTQGTFSITAPSVTPPTGDDSMIALWFGLMPISALAVLLLLDPKKRFAK